MRDAVIPAVRYGSLRNWPRLSRWLGFQSFERTSRGWLLRSRRLEASGGWGIGLELIQWGDDDDDRGPSLMVAPVYGRLYFKLPRRWSRPLHRAHDRMESYGFSWRWTDGGDTIHAHWGPRTKLLHLPVLTLDHQRWEVRRADGSWTLRSGEYEPPYGDCRHVEVHPYRYLMRDGTVQHRTATIYAERLTWKRRWVPAWVPGAHMVRTSISVTFSDEVGERSGSWKGGCIGCNYDLKPGETMRGCLQRMERERSF